MSALSMQWTGTHENASTMLKWSDPLWVQNWRPAGGLIYNLLGLDPSDISEARYTESVIKVVLRGLKDAPGVAAEVFSGLARAGIYPVQISHDSSTKGRADVALAIYESQMGLCQECCQLITEDAGGSVYSVHKDVAMLSFEINPEAQAPTVIADIFEIMAHQGINIDMISYARGCLSFLIKSHGLDRALEALDDHGINPEPGV